MIYVPVTTYGDTVWPATLEIYVATARRSRMPVGQTTVVLQCRLLSITKRAVKIAPCTVMLPLRRFCRKSYDYVRYLVQMRTRKFAFEIKWPLLTRQSRESAWSWVLKLSQTLLFLEYSGLRIAWLLLITFDKVWQNICREIFPPCTVSVLRSIDKWSSV